MKNKIGDIFKQSQNCKICHENELQIIATKGRHYQDLTTTICVGCGLVHSFPVPSEEELNNYYKKQYRSDYKSAYKPKRKHIARYAKNALERLNRLKNFTDSNKKLIDIGSGSGEFVYAAKLAGFDVRGIEPHEGYSNYSRKVFGVEIIESPYQTAKIDEESVDLITIHHVLEHLPNPLSALTHISKWLKFNGIIMIDVPDIENTLHSPMNRFHYAHIYNFNHETLKAFLTKAGFELIDCQENKSGTILAAKKIKKADYDMIIKMPENYKKLNDVLMKGEKSEHYEKKKKIKRFIGKLYRYPKEFFEGILLWSPKKIVKNEFDLMQNSVRPKV